MELDHAKKFVWNKVLLLGQIYLFFLQRHYLHLSITKKQLIEIATNEIMSERTF